MTFTTLQVLVALVTGLSLATGFHVVYKANRNGLGHVKLALWRHRLSLLFSSPQRRAVACGLMLSLLAYALYAVSNSATDSLLLLGNTFATPAWTLRRVARRLVNNCVFAGNVVRDYDDEYKQKGVHMGDTITLRLPQRFQATVGAVMNPTALNDQTVTLTITDQSNVGFQYDSWAATMEVNDYMERYANPAVDQLINNIDFTGTTRMYRRVAKVVGTPGTVPTTNNVYGLAKTRLVEVAVPRPYKAVITADAHTQLSNNNASLFNPGAQISAFFRNGQIEGKALGINEWYEDENVATHVVGALGGTPLVNGATQTGASITADGATASVTRYFRQGDSIQFASVQDLNPQAYQSTGRNKDFVVTADVNSTAGGALTIPISPSIVASGVFQNCDEAPGDNDAITTFGSAAASAGVSTRQGFIYHKEAFALVMADLVLPKGIWISERISNAKLGISVRMMKDSDIINDVHPCRLDTAHGWGAIREELASRICLS